MKHVILIIGLVVFFLADTTAVAIEPLDAFPAAAKGQERFVITLPEKEKGQEAQLQVELVAGKKMLVDGVNQVRLGSRIEPHSLKGWGYTFYEVTGTAEVVGTLMAPPEGAGQVMRFVAGSSLVVRYNSRLPIVIYAPAGYEIRYRIWQAGEEKAAEKK